MARKAGVRPVVLYDRDCGFCRVSLALVLGWDRGRRLRPAPLQSEDARALLPHMDEERMFASAHLVMPDGRVYSGGDAAAPILRMLPGGTPLSAVAGLLGGVSRRGYDWVARNRGLLGRPIPTRAKDRATGRIDARA